MLARFARETGGAAATEFVLLLPVMLMLYFGSLTLGGAFGAQFKTEIAARNVADLASQYTSIDNATMTAILNAAAAVVAPYPPTGMTITVSQVATDANGAGTVAWSDALNAAPAAVGSPVALPAAMQIPNASLIWCHVTYPYQPSFGDTAFAVVTFTRDAYFLPRLGTSVARVAS